MDSEVDRDGIYTFYGYDSLKRRISTTRNGITVSNVLDGAGNVVKSVRVGSDGGHSELMLSQTGYDVAGRVVSETNALGGVTRYGYFYDSSGQYYKTNIYDDGGIRLETYYMDGQLKSVTGSAAHPARYEYGVIVDNGTNRLYSAEIKLGSDGVTDTGEAVTNLVDMAGRTYKTIYCDGAYRQSTFNKLGQLVLARDPDNVQTVYAYNAKGELEYTALGTNVNRSVDALGNPTISFTQDRITQTVRDYTTTNGVNVSRTRNYAWYQANTDSATLVSETRTSTDGNFAWNVNFGLTSLSATSHPGSGARYVTNTAPDGSYIVSYYLYDQLRSATQKDSGGNQVAQTTYGYDSHGRQINVTDARNGTTIYGFNSADQVTSVTTPAPGNGDSPQTTSYVFDTQGRLLRTVMADGGVTTNGYYPSGEVKITAGSRTYPVGYSYDSQGRLKTMTNWSSLASLAGARVTTWNYNTRGFLTNKVYQGTNGPLYSYSPAGRLQNRTWARGIDTSYTNNSLGDLTGVYSNGSAAVSYGFDRVGRRTNILDEAGSRLLAYNDAGLPLSETNTSGTMAGIGLVYQYDQYLRKTNVQVWGTNGLILSHSYGFDAAGRLKTVSDGTVTAGYSYLADSPLIGQMFLTNSGVLKNTTTKTYDHLNRLLAIQTVTSKTNLLSSNYSYNDANQRKGNRLQDGSYWVYDYDDLGQVTSGKRYWEDGTPVAGQQFEYAFDDIGNRTSTKAGGDSSGGSLRSATYEANLLNQYTNRTVPGALDVMGIANASATVTVNGQSTYRKGEYYQALVGVANSSTNVFQRITNVATLSGGTNHQGDGPHFLHSWAGEQHLPAHSFLPTIFLLKQFSR